MRISVTCPSCKKKGTLPEAMRGQRIKCGGCHQPFVVDAPKSEAQPSKGALAAMLEDDDRPYDVQPLRRGSTRQSQQAAASTSTSPMIYAGLGIGGVCGLVLAGVFMLMLSAAPDKPHRESEREAFAERKEQPVETPPPPPVISESDREAALARLKKRD